MEEMILTFSPGGKSQIEVKGRKGKSCQEMTKGLEKALGIVTEDTRTAEYNQAETAEQQTVKARA